METVFVFLLVVAIVSIGVMSLLVMRRLPLMTPAGAVTPQTEGPTEPTIKL